MNRGLSLSAAWLLLAGLAPATGQERPRLPASEAQITVTYTEPADAGQAARLRDLAGRLKSVTDPLENLDRIEIVIVHTPPELSRRLGREDELAGVSYVHGILFLSPVSWQRNPTDEALEHEMERALVRYAANRLAGGNRLPDWLEEGLVGVLTQRPFAPATADLVAQRGPLLLTRWEADDPAVGYWAVRYLVEARGGWAPVRQLLRLVAQRPDTFVEDLQLTYGVSAGEMERAWRAWLKGRAEEGKRQGGPREGPLIKRE